MLNLGALELDLRGIDWLIWPVTLRLHVLEGEIYLLHKCLGALMLYGTDFKIA